MTYVTKPTRHEPLYFHSNNFLPHVRTRVRVRSSLLRTNMVARTGAKIQICPDKCFHHQTRFSRTDQEILK